MPRAARSLLAATLVLLAPLALAARQSGDPRAAMDALLAADRGFAAAAAKTDVVAGLTAMLAADVVMPAPDATFARGPDAVAAALRKNADNDGGRITWTPAGGGLAADGRHGYTFGLMTLTKRDGTTVPLKYLAYWVKGDEGWRVLAYKRGRAQAAPPSPVTVAPVLPARLEPPTAAFPFTAVAALEEAERAFSRDAQVMGLGPAFAKYGSPEAMNLGGPQPGFTLGNEAIARLVAEGAEGTGGSRSPVTWGPDQVIVAGSGDLGVSIGMIVTNAEPPPGRPKAVPFFTIWRRASPDAPWRYVAE
jgi:ketosteroid isomerase-like protein